MKKKNVLVYLDLRSSRNSAEKNKDMLCKWHSPMDFFTYVDPLEHLLDEGMLGVDF